MTFTLKAKAFQHQDPIPIRFTMEGNNVSPELSWTGTPTGTVSFALICDDPDAPAGTWVHWVLYDISGRSSFLPEKIKKDPIVLGTAKQGRNDSRKLGYDGPMPPPGKTHRYFIKLYALDILTDQPAGLTKAQILKVMEGHILGKAEIYGTYRR